MADKLPVLSSSPHIRTSRTTGGIMRDVIIALLPALCCGVYFFGFRALFLVCLSVFSCIGFEYLWQTLLHKPSTLPDGTAAVTGLLLGLNMPVTAPWWSVVIGAFVAIIIAKQLFGGTGHNFVNPALCGRAFLLASWPVLMTRWVMPFETGFFISPDVVSSATPLAILKGTVEGELPSLSSMFLGNISGCIGETSALAILLGGLYLIFRGVIRPHTPVSFIGTVALLSFFFSTGDLGATESMLYHIFGGGLFLAAFFMATDYVTSPITGKGQIVMGIGCGVLTFVIRRFGGYPEGATYAILLLNIATPLIDRFTKPKKFGTTKKGGLVHAKK